VALGSLVSTYANLKALFQLIRLHHPKATIVTGNTLGTSIQKWCYRGPRPDVCVVW